MQCNVRARIALSFAIRVTILDKALVDPDEAPFPWPVLCSTPEKGPTDAGHPTVNMLRLKRRLPPERNILQGRAMSPGKTNIPPVDGIPMETLQLYYIMFKKYLEMTTDGFIAIDDRDRIIEISATYAERLGFTYEQAVGENVYTLIPNSQMPLVRDSGVSESDVPHLFETGPLKDQVVLSSRSAIVLHGKPIAAISQVRYPEKYNEFSEIFNNAYNALNYYKEEYRKLVQGSYTFDDLVGRDERLAQLKAQAKKVAGLDFTVLVRGETGTGKELMAHAIHNASKRAKQPIICVNCAAIPGELLESELFGYEEGAFSGASRKGKIGKIELANRGTLFLDEIGDMPVSMQIKLLRVLQDKQLERLGSSRTQHVDVRIIAATNQNLERKVADQTFRADLFYRLNVISLSLPALRERRDDIPFLASAMLDDLNKRYITFKQFSPKTLEVLKDYSWPGNIRELRNIVERTFSFADGFILEPADLPHQLFSQSKANARVQSSGGVLYADVMDNVERELLCSTLERHNGNFDNAAKELGMHRTTLYRKLKRLNVLE